MACSLFLNGDSVLSGDDDGRAHVAEESVVDNSAYGLDVFGHLSGILDGFFEVKIDDVVSVVGDGNFVSIGLIAGGGSHSEDGLASVAGFEGGNFPHGVLVAERSDLNGDGESGSESVAQLGVVDDDDEFIGHDFDHLFSKKSTATSLDKVQVGVNLIGSINSNIQLGVRIEGDKGNVKAQSLFLGAFGCRDGNNISEFSRFQKVSHPFDGEVCGGTSSKADDHTGLDVIVNGLVADLFLKFVLGSGHVESSGLDAGMGSKRNWGKGVY
mmetsp:Transcript_14234/g.29724  ORF Transcript_14234/g.29724 Transcript_14234/m.29724 type:complete len:269 (+) Transcript_14234:1881-2687(+)